MWEKLVAITLAGRRGVGRVLLPIRHFIGREPVACATLANAVVAGILFFATDFTGEARAIILSVSIAFFTLLARAFVTPAPR